MKRNAIRAEVEAHLLALGFARTAWLWQPMQAELILTFGAAIKRVKLKSGMSRRAMTYELGRIAGWADFAGIEAPKANGHASTGQHLHSQV